ncbi:hypothetical protein BOX15_Mlig022141g2, partial [Macrostomum lignano]
SAKSIFMTAQPNNKPEEEAELPALIISGDACILPFELARIPIGNSQDCKAIAASLKFDGAKHLVATFTSHDADDSETKLAGRIGTVCAVQQLLLLPSPSLVLRGLSRCRFHAWVSGSNSTQVGRRFFWSQQPQQQQSPRRARVAMLTSDVEEVDAEATAEELRQLISLCQRLGVLRASPTAAAASEAAAAAEDASDIKDGERKRLASQLPDLLGGLLSLSSEQRLRLLAATTHRERAAVLLPILRSRLRDKTGDAAAANSSLPTSSPRAGGGPIGELASRLAAADLPKAASEAANRELARLRSITSGAQHHHPEAGVIQVRIATDHLLPKQLSQHGLEPGSVLLREAELLRVIDAYTREAGVRQLERRLARLCRHAALLAAEAPPSEPLRVDADVLRQIFEEADGADCRPTPSPYEQMTMSAANSGAPLEPGVCPVLAVTPHGGEVLLLECGWTLEPAVDGGGQTTDLAPVCTGQVGEVMRESVTLCISWLSSRLNSQLRRNRCRLHVHFPSGAVPKDGTSAGLPLAAALTSLASGTPVRAGVALTGEVTLRGRVLAIGGVPAKLEAAARAGLHSVVLPMANRIEATRTAGRLGLAGRLRLHCVETVDQALRFALEPAAGHRGLGDWPALPIKDEDSTEDREALSARPKL